MRTIVKGKNFEVPERDRLYAERKLQRLERFLDDRSDAIVELSVERHRSAADSHLVDVALVIDGQAIRGKAAAATHRAGIDEVIDKVERRAVAFREKPRARRPEERATAGSAATRPRGRSASAGARGSGGTDTRRSGDTDARRSGDTDARRSGDTDVRGDDEAARRVTKVKRFAIEPMFEEDAVARMEELGHSFFVFVDAETERIAVLYHRRDGDYGLIEPVLGGSYTGSRGESRSRAASGSRADSRTRAASDARAGSDPRAGSAPSAGSAGPARR